MRNICSFFGMICNDAVVMARCACVGLQFLHLRLFLPCNSRIGGNRNGKFLRILMIWMDRGSLPLIKNEAGVIYQKMLSGACRRGLQAPFAIQSRSRNKAEFKNLSNIKFLLRHKMRMIRFLALLDRRFLLQRSMFVI